MLTAELIEEKIVLHIRYLVSADKLPQDLDVLLDSSLGDLPLDSLDLLTLAMKLEDDVGRSIELDAIDESLSLRELALALHGLAK